MRIAANDPGLAHAASRASLRLAGEEVNTAVERDKPLALRALCSKRSASKLLDVYREQFGSRILWVKSRSLQSTARAAWSFALVYPRVGHLIVQIISYRAPDVGSSGRYVALITPHALARMYQRTLHEDDLDGAIERLKPLLIQAVDLSLQGSLHAGQEVRLLGCGGALLGDVESGIVVLRTWVDGETAADPAIRRAAAATVVAP